MEYDEEFYKHIIVHRDKLDVSIEYVFIGVFFREFSRPILVARLYGLLSSFHNVSEGLVRGFVQANMSINIQRIRILVCDKHRWAYSVAFDGASNHEDAHIDVRLRFAANERVHIVHGLVIFVQDTHTGKCIHHIVKQFMKGC